MNILEQKVAAVGSCAVTSVVMVSTVVKDYLAFGIEGTLDSVITYGGVPLAIALMIAACYVAFREEPQVIAK